MQTIRLSAADDKRTLALRIGDKIIVELESNPGTGYEWISADKTISHFDKIHTDYKAMSDTPAPGSAELSVLSFLANEKGHGDLRLHYIQPWNPTQIDKTFTIHYTIEENREND